MKINVSELFSGIVEWKYLFYKAVMIVKELLKVVIIVLN